MSRFPSLWRNLVHRDRVERELVDELQATFESLVQENIARGMALDEARRAARLELGAVESIKEGVRDVRAGALWSAFLQDIRYSFRALARSPAFAAIAVFTLTLGISATTTVFSVVHAVLLRPLPYSESDRLVAIWSSMPASGFPRSPSALPDYREWRATNHTFDELGAYHGVVFALTGDRPERVTGSRLSASIWTVLRVPPHIGSLFTSVDESWGRHRVVVLSHGLWMRRFGGDPEIIGRIVILNDEPFSVVGVMPSSFQFPHPDVEVWTPISYPPGDAMNTRSNHFVDVLGRLKAGVSIQQANADLSVIADRIAREYSGNAGIGVIIAGWHESLVGDVKHVLWLLFGAVGFVLAIACANVAGLLLARGVTRRKELSIRVALGAGRRRLLRQLLTESVVLAGLGALFGAMLSYGLVRVLPTFAPTGVPRLVTVEMDLRVLAFTTLLVVLTSLAFGLWPAWRAGSVDARETLNDSNRTATAGRAQAKGRKVLVVSEVSLSVVLLIGATLLVVSLVRVQQVDPGFRPEQVLTMHVSLPETRYSTPDRIVTFLDQLIVGMRDLPKVAAAAATTALPLGTSDWGKYLTIEGREPPTSMAGVSSVRYRAVTPEYFGALGATMRRGRRFEGYDGARQPRVAIVNETAARRFWPGGDPIHSRVSLGPPEALVTALLPPDYPGGIEGWRASFPWFTVVGVVADLRTDGLERGVEAEVFVPFNQAGEETGRSFYVVARTDTDPGSLRRELEAAVHQVDPNLPVSDIRAMSDRLADSLSRRRFATMVLGFFAATAVLLALVGLYGLMAYTVNQRRREMGIRLAIGAQPRDLLRLVLQQGLWLTAGGIGLGLLLAAALSRLISSQLVDVHAVDAWLYASAALLLLSCAGIACWIPSQRAARMDPLETLREG
jgi:putative ABC transport system permease protein